MVVLDRSSLARHEARIGREEEIVVEGRSRKDPGVLTGRTRQSKLVNFRPLLADVAVDLVPGRFGRVRVTSAGPHHLGGELVSLEPVASARRIPVRVAAR
jgi:tRNA-2-methylthio-N6-dimethylallyladenosine synthase